MGNEIELRRPSRSYDVKIDGHRVDVRAIHIGNEDYATHDKRVILDGYMKTNPVFNFFDFMTFRPVEFTLEKAFPCKIERVIFSGPVTIVFWDDGTKTTVKLAEGSHDDRAEAICWAMAKKYYGTRSQLDKRLGAVRNKAYMWDDSATVYTILMTLFGSPKKLDEYVNSALDFAEDYRDQK